MRFTLFPVVLLASISFVHAADGGAPVSISKPQNAAIPKEKFIGSWELVSGEYLDDKQKMAKSDELQLKSLKILSGSHYNYVTTSKGKFYVAGAGTYTLVGSTYTEIPMYTSYAAEAGNTYGFTARIEGDTWENTRWQDGKVVEHEVWRRTK